MQNIKHISLIFLMLIAACNSSKITTSWKAEDAVVGKYKKILVIGIIRETDSSLQQKMENHLTGDLKTFGYNAISSMQEYGPKAFYEIDEETAIDKIKSSDVDAVITIVLLDKQKERKYVPSSIHYTPYGYYAGDFWNYRTTLYNRIYEPGYYVTNTQYFWESNLYDVTTQKLVYSVQTQSFDPSNLEKLGHEYGQMIVKNMVKQNVLQDQNNNQ